MPRDDSGVSFIKKTGFLLTPSERIGKSEQQRRQKIVDAWASTRETMGHDTLKDFTGKDGNPGPMKHIAEEAAKARNKTNTPAGSGREHFKAQTDAARRTIIEAEGVEFQANLRAFTTVAVKASGRPVDLKAVKTHEDEEKRARASAMKSHKTAEDHFKKAVSTPRHLNKGTQTES